MSFSPCIFNIVQQVGTYVFNSTTLFPVLDFINENAHTGTGGLNGQWRWVTGLLYFNSTLPIYFDGVVRFDSAPYMIFKLVRFKLGLQDSRVSLGLGSVPKVCRKLCRV